MKKLFLLFSLLLFSHLAFAQSSGRYLLKYTGKITANDFKILYIKLPSTSFLHGASDKSSEFNFIDTNLKKGKFELDVISSMTSHLYNSAEKYLDLYKQKHEVFELHLIVKLEGKEKEEEQVIDIEWDKVEIKKVEEPNKKSYLLIDLKEVKL